VELSGEYLDAPFLSGKGRGVSWSGRIGCKESDRDLEQSKSDMEKVTFFARASASGHLARRPSPHVYVILGASPSFSLDLDLFFQPFLHFHQLSL